MRILICDDEPGICRPLASMLRQDGHTVHTTSDAYEAMGMIARGRYDLALVDYIMGYGPELSGAAIARNAMGMTYCVLMTGYDESLVETTGFEVLPKPITGSDLRALCERVQRMRDDTPVPTPRGKT